ncbi:diaminopimelate epimerase [Membranihabitans marinus]|uniref:diaminopimelate epimerase n=1 Tax=Membranihabitans marinus TaxID=1227546 RepID=UPI001F009548|nr:diaminopimelate epimerase [Membranihabitans marinus]
MKFLKYQGTGNDFVIVNGEIENIDIDDSVQIERYCHRKFGVGADGFIIISNHPSLDFEMKYFNADGKIGSMCGNGGRCAVAFAYLNGFFQGSECSFLAYDGLHHAKINPENYNVELSMSDVKAYEIGNLMAIMDTGSPHYVTMVEDLDDIDVVEAGRAIRYSSRFASKGINVNFVETQEQHLAVATYERGVEDETLSCGTGVTASALSYHLLRSGEKVGDHTIPIQTKGGQLSVKFTYDGKDFTNIWLSGPTENVFAGEW